MARKLVHIPAIESRNCVLACSRGCNRRPCGAPALNDQHALRTRCGLAAATLRAVVSEALCLDWNTQECDDPGSQAFK